MSVKLSPPAYKWLLLMSEELSSLASCAVMRNPKYLYSQYAFLTLIDDIGIDNVVLVNIRSK